MDVPPDDDAVPDAARLGDVDVSDDYATRSQPGARVDSRQTAVERANDRPGMAAVGRPVAREAGAIGS
jgi:hypothetical protein